MYAPKSISFILLILLSNPCLAELRTGPQVTVSGSVDEDTYTFGGMVDSSAEVSGDLFSFGGSVRIDGQVDGDVLAGGGDVSVLADIKDDARITGGNIRIANRIGDNLVVAGGNVNVNRGVEIGGDAMLAGGDVGFDGTLAGDMNASAGRLSIGGTINGDVDIWAERVFFHDSAVIRGDVRYHSPHEAEISAGAVIDGEVTHTVVEIPTGPLITGAIVGGLFTWLSIAITAIVLYLGFTRFAQQSAQISRERFAGTAGIGLGVLAATPLVIMLLFSTGIGALLGFLLLLDYVALLVIGYITGAYALVEWWLSRSGKMDVSRTVMSLWIAGTLFLLSLVVLIPVIGFIIALIVLCTGMGALTRLVFESRTGRQQPV